MNKYIEHTLLKQDATKSEIKKLVDEARKYGFFGVCVNPCNVAFVRQYLKDTDKSCDTNAVYVDLEEHNENKIKIVTVIGFPLGQSTTESKVLETIDAVKNGADEIDMVINGGKLKDGEHNYIVEEISKVKFACQNRNLKVIIETDLLNKDEIQTACELCIKGGADFVKTSTGFVKNGVGAKAEDVKLMYDTVHAAGLQVKASGGIRDKEAALKMIEAGATRLGTSSGVKIVTA